MAKLIDGRAIAEKVYVDLRCEIAHLKSNGVTPGLAVILVQSPPPKQIDEPAIVHALDPRKDVDGFHPENIAKLAVGDSAGLVPCTPLGVQRLLIESKIDIGGAHVVIR